MSELVQDNFFVNFEQNFSIQSSPQSSYYDVLDGLLLLIQRANSEGYDFKVLSSPELRRQGKLQSITHFRLNDSIFDLVLEIIIDIKNKKLQCKTSFLQEEQFLLTQSNAKRKMICRKFLKINNELESEGLKFIQNMDNGQITLLTISEQSQFIFNSKDLIWNKAKSYMRKICQVCKNQSTQILQIINKQKYKKYFLKNGGQQLKKIRKEEYSYTKLVKQLQVSHINFGFSSKPDQSTFSAPQRMKEQEQKLRQFVMHTKNQKFQTHSKKLYLCDYQEFLEMPAQQISYELEPGQSKIFASYLKTPIPKDPSPGENKFIFNHIEIVRPESVKFRDTYFEGGKNKLFVSKLSFHYCQSSFNNKASMRQPTFGFFSGLKDNCQKNNELKQSKQPNIVLTKMIALKVPKKKTNEKYDQKFENEKNIIKLFKDGVSAYILKYYVSRQQNFQYRNCLLIDYLPNSQPLSNFLEIFKETLSINSKAYIIVNLANSMRFLSDYSVVHMDLNLNNFLVYRDYLTKLIDFGQSYSPNLSISSGTSLKRAYTFPFCSPEYFERKTNFSPKQDVFSLGMIIWRMIFNDYPFFTSVQALQSYKDKTYMERIFLAPERGEAYCNMQAIDFIYKLIFKCLEKEEYLRCETSWITIFFKIIYFYLL